MNAQQNAVSRAYHAFKNAAESLPKAETQQDFIRGVSEAHRCLLDIVKHYKPGVEQCDDTLGMTDEEYKVMRGRWLSKHIPFPHLSPDFLSLPTAAEICSAEKISGATILDSLNRFDALLAGKPHWIYTFPSRDHVGHYCQTKSIERKDPDIYRYTTLCGQKGQATSNALLHLESNRVKSQDMCPDCYLSADWVEPHTTHDHSKADSPLPFLVPHFKEYLDKGTLCLTQNLTPLKAGGYRYVTFCGNRGDALDSAFYPETDTQKVTCPKCSEIHNQIPDLDALERYCNPDCLPSIQTFDLTESLPQDPEEGALRRIKELEARFLKPEDAGLTDEHLGEIWPDLIMVAFERPYFTEGNSPAWIRELHNLYQDTYRDGDGALASADEHCLCLYDNKWLLIITDGYRYNLKGVYPHKAPKD